MQDAFGNRSRDAKVGLAGVSGGNAVTVMSAPSAQAGGVVDGSIKYKLNQSFELNADLRGRFGSGQTDASASLGAAFRF